jgi:hypothetical protein
MEMLNIRNIVFTLILQNFSAVATYAAATRKSLRLVSVVSGSYCPATGRYRQVLSPGHRALSSAVEDVAAGSRGGAGTCPGWAVPPALLSGWGRRVVVMQRLVIGPFQLKFDHLNTNSTVCTEN